MEKILIGYPLNKYEEFDRILESFSRKYRVVTRTYDYKWLKENIHLFTAVIPSLNVIIDDEVIRGAKNLKLIFTPTTGCDHIRIKKCPHIKVLSLRDCKREISSINSTAELGFALILTLARNIVSSVKDVKELGSWDRNKFLGRELKGKVLGIIGMGRIGQKIGSYGRAFGMEVIYWDKVKYKNGIKINSLRKMISLGDYLVISISLNKESYHLINRKNIRFIKRGASLVNISRGKVIEEKALCWALNKGILSGVGTDVLEFELEGFKRSPLYKYARSHPGKNIIITPHLGGATLDAWKKVFFLIAKKIERLLR